MGGVLRGRAESVGDNDVDAPGPKSVSGAAALGVAFGHIDSPRSGELNAGSRMAAVGSEGSGVSRAGW